MHRLMIASVVAAATLPFFSLAGSAAPMSTSDLLKPQSDVAPAYCQRYCHIWGWCGYGYHKHKCCKVWHSRCH
jgi:hypothetical protein